jgi:cyanophycinase
MSPARVSESDRRGWIVPVGGAEDKDANPQVLQRFIEVSGGKEARIAIIPTASSLPDTGERYENIFSELGVAQARSLSYQVREDTKNETWLGALREATGIFLTGGNQLRISAVLGGTDVARTIRRQNAKGVTVGGTSAGAAILSEHMIAFGESGATPRAGQSSLAPGMGLTNRVVIDQHFRQRNRMGRLMNALAYNPFAVGLGLDEDTAAFIDPDDIIEVVGSDALTIVDPADLKHSSMPAADQGEVLCLINFRVHILNSGAQFNLQTREARPPS